jgi:prolyl 4-hydroxylase
MESAGQEKFQGTFSEDLVTNPLQAFQMIKRLSINFRKIQRLMKRAKWAPIRKLSSDFAHLMPKEDDLNGAALSVIRLQDTYNLTEHELIQGRIGRVHSNVQMNSRDCFYFGKQSFNNGYYGHALQWFEHAFRLSKREKHQTTSTEEILPFYEVARQVVSVTFTFS